MSAKSKDVASRFLIHDMKILELGFDKATGEAEYRPIKQAGRGIYPDYPILIQGNGLPWTLGNIYLLKRMEDAKNYEPSRLLKYRPANADGGMERSRFS